MAQRLCVPCFFPRWKATQRDVALPALRCLRSAAAAAWQCVCAGGDRPRVGLIPPAGWLRSPAAGAGAGCTVAPAPSQSIATASAPRTATLKSLQQCGEIPCSVAHSLFPAHYPPPPTPNPHHTTHTPPHSPTCTHPPLPRPLRSGTGEEDAFSELHQQYIDTTPLQDRELALTAARWAEGPKA